jgi:hypothetical protein
MKQSIYNYLARGTRYVHLNSCKPRFFSQKFNRTIFPNNIYHIKKYFRKLKKKEKKKKKKKKEIS